MNQTAEAKHYRWSQVEQEQLKGTITRRLITGDSMMIAEVLLKKGDEVPRHAHHNEQITFVLSGALKFVLGDEQRETVVRGGEVLVIPPHVPHAAFALEDTVDIDVFSPPREDWLAKTDAYLR
ncbi:MAG TPA: cupin domain-containing protein [Candidatus Limnocylindria bacterium]|jgi:quercetin dioxygenase-like cupin family protein|nr:cupin domain-containing protein [Candidatus Limnocylindria bacterium]